jgi:hypothetical protein
MRKLTCAHRKLDWALMARNVAWLWAAAAAR